jgi:putative two-component system response regulator
MPNKETLLIVEDNHELRNGLKEILSFEGYTVLAAANGREAIEQMKAISPDLILSDISMPEMDGYEFFDVVRSRPEGITIPFIFLTARGERDEVMKGKNLGAEDYLVKPLTRNELLAAVQAKLTRFRQLQLAQLEQAYEASLIVLANVIEVRDRYTRGHVERVRDYALVIAEQLGLPEKRRLHVRYGAILHDIGKILIAERTLTKASPLNDVEWAEMRQHPVVGAEMLKDVPFLAPAIPIVRFHHERWDGTGYPDGLTGNTIPLEARIVSVADGFDAMTTTRPYHQAWPLQRACDEVVNGAGSYFDPLVVSAFQKGWNANKIQLISITWQSRHTTGAEN